MYISYTPSVEDATQWMGEISRREVVKGWHRATYELADESYLWNADDGTSYLYFRQGSLAVEVSGSIADVKRFAKYAEKQMPPGEHQFP
jgi:hypothetical protein